MKKIEIGTKKPKKIVPRIKGVVNLPISEPIFNQKLSIKVSLEGLSMVIKSKKELRRKIQRIKAGSFSFKRHKKEENKINKKPNFLSSEKKIEIFEVFLNLIYIKP